MDVIVDKSGKVASLIIGVGGFLGAGEKDVAVPFDAVHVTTKDNNKWYLVMNATKDHLKNARASSTTRMQPPGCPKRSNAGKQVVLHGGNHMSKKAAEQHKKASEHLTHAARHHGEAAKHYEAGSHEKAAHHAHIARGHAIVARGCAEEAVKAHIEEHGKK